MADYWDEYVWIVVAGAVLCPILHFTGGPVQCARSMCANSLWRPPTASAAS